MNDGGPAFPHGSIVYVDSYDPGIREQVYAAAKGMSLRDWFAGMALASMTVAPDYSKGHCNSAMAERAYLIADAMIAEREKTRTAIALACGICTSMSERRSRWVIEAIEAL